MSAKLIVDIIMANTQDNEETNEYKLLMEIMHCFTTSKNYKKAKILIFENNLFSKIDINSWIEYWGGYRKNLFRLECCLNSQEYIERKDIIKLFNRCATFKMTCGEKIMFKMLINEYGFGRDDALDNWMVNIMNE